MHLRRASSLTCATLAFFLGDKDPSTVQTSVICSVAAGITPSSLTSFYLAADYVVLDVFTTQAFTSMISSLTQLRLVSCHPNAPDLEPFWQDVVPAHFLQPPMATLTELLLHPGVFIGTFTSVPFPYLYFPCLTRLSLKMFLFEPTNDLEGFIIRHSSTLRHLCLYDCAVITHHVVDSIRFQSDIWYHFAKKLEALIEVKVGEDWDNIADHYEHGVLSRYMTCAMGRHQAYNRDDRVQTPDRMNEDKAALETLKAVVNARSRTSSIKGA
jgi:hypothetical protein